VFNIPSHNIVGYAVLIFLKIAQSYRRFDEGYNPIDLHINSIAGNKGNLLFAVLPKFFIIRDLISHEYILLRYL